MGRISRKKRAQKISGTDKATSGNVRTDLFSMTDRLWPISIIILVSFGTYFGVLFNGFVYDDNYQVLENPWIKDMTRLPEIFSKSVWSFQPEHVVSNYYRPLMHVGYMVIYFMFGLSPVGFHLVNIAIHAGVSVLVFLVISMLLSDSEESNSSYLSPPFIAALLFAAHPIHTEAVSWVAGLPELSFTFFCLLSFYFYLRMGDSPVRNYLLSLAFFAVAAFAKETALTVPIIFALHDLFSRRTRVGLSSYFKRYVPFMTVAGVYMVLRFHALGGIAPQKAHHDLTIYQYVINVFPLFVQYLEKLLLPLNLNAFHVFHPISSIFEAKGIFALVVTASFLVLACIGFRKNRLVIPGVIWIVVPLLPVLYIPGLGENTFAERYLYLPSFGFVMLCSLLTSPLLKNASRWSTAIATASFVLVGLYAAETAYRNTVWKDDYRLFADTVRKSPDGALPHNNFGAACREKGLIDEAIREYQTAQKLKPSYPDAYNNLGVAYMDKGLTDEAINQYRIALRLRPDYAEAHNNLGAAYREKGLADDAMKEYQIALALKPDYAKAHNNMGLIYRDKGLIDKAVAEYRLALKSGPGVADIHNNLAVIYRDKGLTDEAIKEYEAALKLKPDYAEAHNNLGVAYRDKGRTNEAVEQFKTAIKLKPAYADPYNNMGTVYWGKGRLDEAIEQYQIALRLKRDYVDAHNNIAIAYRDKGQTDKAVEHYRIALKLRPDSAEIHNNLAVLYARKGMKEDAIREFRDALRIRPDLTPARQALDALTR